MTESLQSLWVPAAAALVGALLGALASVGATLLSARGQRKLEEAGWKREDQARFHLYRRELYARFLARVSTVFQSSGAIAPFAADALVKELPQFRTQMEALQQSMADLTLVWEEISLVGSAAVVRAAREINGLAAGCRLYVYLPDGKEKIAASHDQYQGGLRSQFLRAAREELGLPPL